MSNNHNTRWFQRNPKKALLGFVILTYILCDLVAGSWLLCDTARIYHPFYHHGLANNQKSRSKWGQNTYVMYTNSLGFKDEKKRNIPLESQTYRIVVIGDSFTEGLGYPHEKTFVGITEKNLHTTKIEIFNAGVMSYCPKLYYLKIQYLLEKVGFRFNALYVYLDVSDIQDEIVYRDFTPGKESFIQRVIRAGDDLGRNHSYTYRMLRDYMLYGNGKEIINSWRTKLKKIIQKNSSSPCGDQDKEKALMTTQLGDNNTPEHPQEIDMQHFYESYTHDRDRWFEEAIFQAWGKQGLRLAEEHMKQLYALCNTYGIKMVIAVYPWKNHIKSKELTSRQVTFWQVVASQYSIDFLNYFPDFINETEPSEIIKTYFIPGDVHWNDKGHELIATKLINHIRKIVK